ncbi:MAG: tRNA-dihydrouridine synthase [Planctomycetota bacterium]|nr:tRNA-dihydrouridine synthase [Planctomycetota bacterium]
MLGEHQMNPAIGRPLRIGPLALGTNLLLAPVANYCDLAWRLTCRELGGVGLACTDLLSPQGLLRGTAHSLDLAKTTEDDRPLCMQLYGGDGDILAEGALWAVRHGATVIDINMGCPVDKVTKKDGGSKMLCDPARTVAIASNVVRTVERATGGAVPVTAKMRLGWDESCMVAPDLAVALAREGIRAITVHGRTASQKFLGACSLEGIRTVVQAVEAALGPPAAGGGGPPVIGNGDVTDAARALEMLRVTGCAGVMIGRGSFSRPWLFRQAWAAQTLGLDSGAPELAEPGEAEKIAIIRRYFRLMLEHRDAHYALNHMRRRISWMGKALGPCKPLKERVRTAADALAVELALDEFLAGGLRSRAGAGADELEEVGA